MKMNTKDRARIEHMLKATQEALSFMSGISKEAFFKDRKLILAIIKEIEIVGEAASKVTSQTQLELSNIPWEEIVSTRHRLIHGYFDINLEIVWVTLIEDLPDLLKKLEKILL